MNVGDGELPWGGIEKVGALGSFYVSVHARLYGANKGLQELKNFTLDVSFE